MANSRPKCWKLSSKAGIFSIYSRFGIGLAAGNISVKNFLYFSSQEKFFLEAFLTSITTVVTIIEDEELKQRMEKLERRVARLIETHPAHKEQGDRPLKYRILPQTYRFLTLLSHTTETLIAGVEFEFDKMIFEKLMEDLEADCIFEKIISGEHQRQLACIETREIPTVVITTVASYFKMVTHEFKKVLSPADEKSFRTWMDFFLSKETEAWGVSPQQIHIYPKAERFYRLLRHIMDKLSDGVQPQSNILGNLIFDKLPLGKPNRILERLRLRDRPLCIERKETPAFVMATIAAFFKTFSYVARNIKAILSPAAQNNHMKWFEFFTANEFEEFGRLTLSLLDSLSDTWTQDRVKLLERQFELAMGLQAAWFSAELQYVQPVLVPLQEDYYSCMDMRPEWFLIPEKDRSSKNLVWEEQGGFYVRAWKEKDRSRRRLSIFSNFDWTCSTRETRGALLELAGHDIKSLEDLIRPLESKEVKNIVLLEERSRPKKFDFVGLSQAIDRLNCCWRQANCRVAKMRLLQGLSSEQVQGLGAIFPLREGCREFFEKMARLENDGMAYHVISRSWSAGLIHFSLGPAVRESNIHAGEMIFDGGLTTGQLVCLEEKGTKWQIVMAKSGSEHHSYADCLKKRKNLVVVIGGDGDLLPMLRADIGVFIHLSEAVRRLAVAFGVKIIPLLRGVVQHQRAFTSTVGSHNWCRMNGVLFQASSWVEIEAFILGFLD